MAVTAVVLRESVAITVDPTALTVYTAPTSTTTIIDKCTITSYHTTTSVVVLYLVPFGGAAADVNAVLKKTLAAKEVYTCPEIVGHILAPGDFLVAISSTVSTSVRASGREIT